MKIEELKILKGPNIWSVDVTKLVALKVSLFDIDNPSARAHEILHAALELQQKAGIEVDFGLVRPTDDPFVYYVVFEYCFEESAEPVAISAMQIAKRRIYEPEASIENDTEDLEYLCERHYPGLSTGSLIAAAKRRGIPVMPAEDDMYYILGYGCCQEKFNATITGHTRMLGVDIASNKDDTKRLLSSYSIPVPKGTLIRHEQNLEREIRRIGYPVVIKPLDGNHGRGITVNIKNLDEAIKAFRIAKHVGDAIVIEKFVTGFDYRVLVLGGKFAAAVKRIPAYVIGDGMKTIRELIDDMNREPRRQKRPGNILKQIEIDELTINLLLKSGMTPDSIPLRGETVTIKETANVSMGGMPVDVTEEIHPANIFLAERIAKVFDIDVCGVDILSPDLSVPLRENNGAVVEVNAAPGIRMHITPAEGKGVQVADKIMEMLFPKGKEFLIPIIAVTGTNGKTTTVRLLSKIFQNAGKIVGNTTTDGIYVNGILLEKGDCSGPKSARYILKDPSVETAVLECARGGILREGLGFSSCDIGIVTNISEDHLGIDGVDTIDDLVRVKSVVPRSVKESGFAILNAEDEKCLSFIHELKATPAFFSVHPENPVFRSRVIEKNGTGSTIEKGQIVVYIKGERTEVCSDSELPVTKNGRAKFMTANVLSAVLAAFLQKVPKEIIVSTLRSFETDEHTAPGRLNEFQFGNFKVLVDYAHNAEGLHALGAFLECEECSHRIGILSVPGDRRDEDIIRFGEAAADYFDEIIIKNDKDLRGRSEANIHNLLFNGISKVKPDIPIHVIPKEKDALEFAVKRASEDSLITVLTESPFETIGEVKKLQKSFSNGSEKRLRA